MNLMQFSQQTPPTFPIIIIWPAGAPIAVIGEQWIHLTDGRVEAFYRDKDDLRLALTITQWIREPMPPKEQAALLPMGVDYYSQ